MKKISQQITAAYISPCSLGWALGALKGLCLGLYYLFVNQLNWEFLWFNQVAFGELLVWMPRFLQPQYNTTPLLFLIATLYGMVVGGVIGLLFGLVYNWANRMCNCKWCKV